jgi:toxin ParE1/3/4
VRAVRYLEEAREEYLHEVGYFAAVSPLLAAKFDRAVAKSEALAAEFAEMGMPYKHGTRRVIPGKFKFSIVYLTLQDEILVVAVAPFKRKQGYWRSRLSDA